ncbi:hemolysin D [Rummeliibacillus sp. TYF005]|uniref:PAQR family membrane homeostasis protein TrhA n=1 Tax=unclassified Rummeliibacillus TaxID=2622809 RepID=UPI000E662C80|nr:MULTISPECIES: hemolysin III family protein [unclassified Rummeliibacillus]RIJ64406.1 hemolysin D [Rummeliibacillus sp. POC4]RPJ95030.1 hemolysin D [Rummeliibacillus sp. TYF005]
MAQAVILENGYSKKEEFWNALTHGVSFLLAIPGLILLIEKANENGSKIELFSYIVFGLSMMLLFLCSTLYHSVPIYKSFFKKMDHSSIYFLIAGTYTPIALVAVGGKTGWVIFWIEWILTIIGVIMKMFFVYRFKTLSLIVYLGMGWLIVFAYKPLITHITLKGFLVLLLGGVIYSVGTYFYKNKRIPYNHAIWHVFVMAGCAAMFASVYYFI